MHTHILWLGIVLALGFPFGARAQGTQRDTARKTTQVDTIGKNTQPDTSVKATQPDTTVKITFGGFVDGYYAWDFDRPPTIDRSFAGGAPFMTQPARHNEFNVNLAFIDVKLEGPTVHGRLALQAGTSVQANYAGEATIGQISGPSLARVMQEAYGGAKLAEGLWVDGGIFFSHLGMESWISRDNPTYTRSLVAEYSPYYQSGVRLVWTASSRWTAQLDVVNGWQNISENNSGKGAGVRLDYTLATGATISYYNFFSDEAGNRLRTFNGVGGKYAAGSLVLLGEADVGTQSKSAADSGTATWWGFQATARVQVTSIVGISGRVERYSDPDQVLVVTGSFEGLPNPALQANGGSIGLDVAPQARALWRTELRGFWNNARVFWDGTEPTRRKQDGFIVTSLAVTF
ncbi:MAG TPA: outer membrane beta-barrel protein [Gemmatimonadaceae bacterium]